MVDADDRRLSELCSRLEVLERENRMIKSIGCLLALVAASLFLMAQAKSDRTIEAQRFVLKDANGKLGGVLEMDKLGARLVLNAPNGLNTAILTGSTAPSLYLNGEAATLGLIRGEKQIAMTVNESSTTFGLYGKDTGPFRGIQVGLSVVNDVSALSLYDKNGSERVTAEANPSHGPSVTLRDRSGNTIWNAP
jgi:hypothetical protein